LLNNSLGARFHPGPGTKYAGFGTFRARFVLAISSMPTFSTSCNLPRTGVNKAGTALPSLRLLALANRVVERRPYINNEGA
jgi:hypothetical protein